MRGIKREKGGKEGNKERKEREKSDYYKGTKIKTVKSKKEQGYLL